MTGTILAIVSNGAVRQAVVDALSPQATVEAYGELAAAAAQFRTRTPDLVLVDLGGLPPSPLTALGRVRALVDSGPRRVPIIVLGSPDDVEKVLPHLDRSIDDVMVSPLQPTELRLRVGLRAPSHRPVTIAPANGKRRRILVVDDKPENVLLLEKFLERDYVVDTAFDGLTALRVAAESRPDLILLDVRMPGMNGFQVCEALKQSEATRMTPVVMVTANADDRTAKLTGLERGADDFLIKPIDFTELSARVRNLIRVKALIDENRELERENERAHIMREVIFAVTNGKLELTDDTGLERLRAAGTYLGEVEVVGETQIAAARDLAEKTLAAAGVDEDRIFDFVLCVSEAATNAVKHAGGGTLQAWRVDGRLQMWMTDTGEGIDFSLLPRSTLMKGWSSKPSLGCGFTIMLEMLDRLLLHTRKGGTTVVMEMAVDGSGKRR